MCVYRSRSELAARAAEELRHSRHRVRLAFGSMGRARGGLEAHTLATGLSGGKLQNLNEIWALAQPPGWPAPDWVVAIDDDIVLPERFLDRFLAVCEAFHLKLAQPAQTRRSHAAWRVTRRRAGSLARETRFVEIGPVTAFAREAARELVPFPDLRYGWGLDSHWGALADERGWRLGVVDAVPVRHEHRPVSADYPHAEAVAEARRFLAGRPHLRAEQAQETLRVHRDPPGGRPRGRRGRGRRRDGGEAQA